MDKKTKGFNLPSSKFEPEEYDRLCQCRHCGHRFYEKVWDYSGIRINGPWFYDRCSRGITKEEYEEIKKNKPPF